MNRKIRNERGARGHQPGGNPLEACRDFGVHYNYASQLPVGGPTVSFWAARRSEIQ